MGLQVGRNEPLLKYRKRTNGAPKERYCVAIAYQYSILKAFELANERGASNSFTTLPLKKHGFCLSREAFWHALCLRCNWPLKDVPSHCACGKTFSVEHCLSFPTPGFPAIRHNEVRDITAERLTKVCSNVEVEPLLEHLFGKFLALRTSITGD